MDLYWNVLCVSIYVYFVEFMDEIDVLLSYVVMIWCKCSGDVYKYISIS